MVVLCYHRVNSTHDDWNNITVSEKTFIEQLKYLRANYNIVRTSEDILKENTIAISFDDGYEDTYLNAFPILQEMRIPATLFISTLCIDKDTEDWCNELSRLLIEDGIGKEAILFRGKVYATSTLEERKAANWQIFRVLKQYDNYMRKQAMDEIREWAGITGSVFRPAFRMLRSSQIRELADSKLITVGSHTVNHPSLAVLSEEEQKYELAESKLKLESITGRPVTEFAYPFGYPHDYSKKTIHLLKRLGFERAFITHPFERFNDDCLFEIRRLCISECSIDEFAEKIRSEIILNQK